MLSIRHLFIVILALCSFANASALELKNLELDGSLSGRSSLNFSKKAKNIEYTLPKGTKGEAIETRRLKKTGAYGVRIKITELPKSHKAQGANSPKIGDITWVYYSQNNPMITFFNAEEEAYDDPEEALLADSLAANAIDIPEGVDPQPALPTRQYILSMSTTERSKLSYNDPNLKRDSNPAHTEGGICINCSNLPYVTADENNMLDLAAIGENIESELQSDPSNPWSQFPEVMKYSQSKEVLESIKHGMKNKKRKSKRQCYRYLKRSILAGGLVDKYLSGGLARQGIQDLEKEGFTNMLDNPKYAELIKHPKDAPKGAILVYRNTKKPKAAGHIEIRTDWGDKGGYVSDFFRGTDHTIPNRELIGVMIKS